MSRTGIIGGSALYNIEELEVIDRKRVSTPFGDPSDEFVIGTLAGKEVVFLPRHGRGHNLLPTEINFKANIYAFKVLGVERLISVAAVGSLKEEICPMDVLLVDQFIDRTNQARPTTFFGDGIVAHIPFAEPVCPELREAIYTSNRGLDLKIHDGGTYVNMEGPAFSTKAESYLYKSWGIDVIGMTSMPEARLAREAGICYATMAMITDYDCWYLGPEVDTVSVEMITENLNKNMETAKLMLRNTVANMPERRSCACGGTLRGAIVTRKEAVPQETLEKLKPIIDGFI
ncbi:MAG: S-methyl-5'-thioadenosine phosphorylase [Candidatus Makaraimicrobium thalassicum]|nr:MAG: S-methyl-5'-thioadenosine phosphorylase [Candidatus Omnitrophota bacterium]